MRTQVAQRLLQVFAVFITALFCVQLMPSTTCAQGFFADTTCDPDYYESLKSRAWLEAQREITQNQNLIFKSDSVLEYSCFDQYLDHLANATISRPMFSMTTRWGAPSGNITAHLNPVATAASVYDQANFNHGLLGGRTSVPYNIQPAVVPGNYACPLMNQIWEVAKCMNFIQDPANDGFFTFEEYAASADKRTLPTPCTAAVDYLTNINQSVGATAPWEQDQVEPSLDFILPSGGGCGGDESLIETGLMINRADASPNQYAEQVCLIPGCHFIPSGASSGRCSAPVQP